MPFSSSLLLLAKQSLKETFLSSKIKERYLFTGNTSAYVHICLTLMLHEGYLADVSLIYAMVSFLAVVVICRIYIGTYTQHHEGEMRSLSDHKAEKEEEPHA